MDVTQRAAYVFAMAVGGLIESMGMFAENQDRLSKGHSIAFDYVAFQKVADDRGLHHNSILTIFHGE